MVCENLDLQSDWPPTQETECMAVAVLNLLKLQVIVNDFQTSQWTNFRRNIFFCFALQLHLAISNDMDPASLGLDVGSKLLVSLKQRVVELASLSGVLNTIQVAAQATLQSSWNILLPTADERARTLSSLLPHSGCLLFFSPFIIIHFSSVCLPFTV